MSEHNFDIVIIGAGPAGMGCAIPLVKNHASLCVIDRATFPRDKTCAGLVTGKTYRLIVSLYDGEAPDDLFCFTSGSVRLFRRTELLVDAPLEHSVRLVNRKDFDNALVERYKQLGGTLYEGEAGLSIDYPAKRIILKNGDTVTYQYLLFADGALSLAHRLLKVDKRDLAFGIEAYIPSEKLSTDSIDLYFGYLDSGYAWVFPHGKTVCVGAADLYDRKTDYRRLLEVILADLGVDAADIPFKGAYLPYGTVIPQDDLDDNILLLGDAGGFTDPISGEGLYMALQSGAYAAKALLTTAEPKEAYLDYMDRLTRTVKDGKRVQKTFYSPPVHKLFLKKVVGKSALVSYFFEQMVEDYRYEYRDVRRLYSDYKKTHKE